MSKKVQFKVSSGLKNIIGKELITNEVVAVFELVKNSYDAGSDYVEVIIDLIKNEMLIRDKGHGMNYNDLLNKWLFVAYSEKKDALKDTNSKIKYTGAKGIGRFACDRLGKETKIYTKKANEYSCNLLEIDWQKFEISTKNNFDDIPVFYTELNSYSEYLLNTSCGTTIKISQLSDSWDSKKIKRLYDSLTKLVNPFQSKDEFQIQLTINSNELELSSLSSKIENNILEMLKDRTIYLHAEFKNYVDVELVDRGEPIYKITSKNGFSILNGIKMEVFYLNPPAKAFFEKKMGVYTKEYGNIFVYKNNFRIYPFGEPDYDGFGLDMRKNQGYNRHIGNRELIGWISIEDPENNFIEVSSRDRGFIENQYVTTLKDSYLEFIHRPLEKYVNLIKWGYDNINDHEIFISEIDLKNELQLIPNFLKKEEFEVNVSEKILDRISPTIEKQLDYAEKNLDKISQENLYNLLKTTNKEMKENKRALDIEQKENQEKSKSIDSLTKQNELLKNLANEDIILQTEITHHMSKSSNELITSVENIHNALDKNSENYQLLLTNLADILNVANKLKVFNDVILRGNFSAKNKISINLYDYFDFYINTSSSISNYAGRIKINLWLNSIKCSKEEWACTVQVYDISIIIDNMLSNIFDLAGTFLDIEFTKTNNQLEIVFFSDTPQIRINDLALIFNLGYSTKKNGTGIGLYHIKETVVNNDWNINVINVEEGVKFIITL